MTCSSAARWAVFKFLLLIGAITCTASSLEEPAVYQGDIFPELSSDIKEGCPEWLTGNDDEILSEQIKGSYILYLASALLVLTACSLLAC